jgi:phytoene dehydrogenase-like protein
MSAKPDAVIIGAGHNGLVAAFYLAKAGLKPLLLERRSVAGGSAITDDLFPGFKCPTLAHTCGPIRPEILKAMRLERYHLQIIEPETRLWAPCEEGRGLLLANDLVKCAAEIARISKSDAEKFLEFHRVLARLAEIINPVMNETPPDVDHPSRSDSWNLLRSGRRFRSLGKKDMYRLLRWIPMPAGDLVAEWFETELLRAVVASRGIFGNFLGPASAGSSAVLLIRAAADPHPAGAACFPRGGVGALAQAMASAAIEAGAQIRTGSEVSAILAKDGAVNAVRLSTGEEIRASLIVSNADPKRTLLGLVGPVHLDPNFVVKLRNYRSTGAVAKVNLALSGLPTFTALEGIDHGNAALAGRIHIGPTLEYLERAFDDAKYGSVSRAPILEVAIPSLADPSLAPAGQHVMSIYAQFAPFHLKSGNWKEQREALGDLVIKTLATYAPNLPSLVLHRQVITPQDLEENYGLTGGHIFHGELTLDQLFTMRPLLGWARYRTPISGLYLCGSGTHPGSGLTGASGANAAREILKDWKTRKRG